MRYKINQVDNGIKSFLEGLPEQLCEVVRAEIERQLEADMVALSRPA